MLSILLRFQYGSHVGVDKVYGALELGGVVCQLQGCRGYTVISALEICRAFIRGVRCHLRSRNLERGFRVIVAGVSYPETP